MGIFELLVVVSIVFCWLQEIFLMEPWKVPTGYVEMEELKPSNDRYFKSAQFLASNCKRRMAAEKLLMSLRGR
jgi:hypothetical protein